MAVSTKKDAFGRNIIIDEQGNPTGQTVDVGTSEVFGTPITSAAFTPVPSSDFQTPQSTPTYPVAGLGQDLFVPTEPEKQATDISKRLQELNQRLVGESTFRAEQEAQQGVPEATKTFRDLSAQLKGLQNEALAIPLQLQQEAKGRGITVGGLRPLETERLRTNAIQALGVSSLLEASRGNLVTAFDLVDRAVAQQFDPIKEEIRIKSANLDLVIKSPEYSLADKRRAQLQKEMQDARIKEIAKKEADEKEIKGYAVEAAQKGATSDILQRIQTARTPQEALQIAGFYFGADFRQEIKDKQFQKDLQEATFNLSVEKFNEDMRQSELKLGEEKRQFNIQQALNEQKFAYEKLKRLQEQDPIQAAEASPAILDDKVTLITNLLDHRGMAKAVGPSRFGRFTPFKIDVLSGDVQDFIAGVQQLVNKETIDTLVNLKARGGTLGALSDQERILLQSAATKIGSWQIKDKNENVTGYNISEKAFKTELKRIQDLAITAQARALGGSAPVIDNEEAELRSAGYSEEQIRLLKNLEKVTSSTIPFIP